MSPESFETLVDLFLSGEATPQQVAHLEALLRADATKRREFTRRCLLEVHLHKAVPEPGGRWSFLTRRGVVAWLAGAAAVLAGVGVGWHLLTRAKGATHDVLAGEVLVDNAPAARIPEGVWFEIGDGAPAVIALADGSRAEMEPRTRAVIRGPVDGIRQVILLDRGGGKFRVAHGGRQFRVDTTVGTVTALGTEFGADLRPAPKKGAGADRAARLVMAVAVTEGEVQIDTKAEHVTLSAGKTRIFGDDGEQNNKDDGQQNNRDDGQKNNKDDGQQNNKDDGGRN